MSRAVRRRKRLIRWKLAYLDWVYGRGVATKTLLQMAQEADFHSLAAWRHWLLWKVGMR